MTTLRDKLAAKIYGMTGFDSLSIADACLAVLAAEPVSGEAVAAAHDVFSKAEILDDGQHPFHTTLTAFWRSMLGVKP